MQLKTDKEDEENNEYWIDFQRESLIIKNEKIEELQKASMEYDELISRKPAIIKVLDNTTKNQNEIQCFNLPF